MIKFKCWLLEHRYRCIEIETYIELRKINPKQPIAVCCDCGKGFDELEEGD